jgi:hypothetical protein
MDFEKALKFAVICSWDDLVKPEENRSIHVEYVNVDGKPVSWLQIWAMHKGNGNRVCDYSLLPSSGSQLQGTQFAGSYASLTLAEALDVIMQNQTEFTRSAGRSTSGLVRVGVPSNDERARASDWWQAITTEVVRSPSASSLEPRKTAAKVRARRIEKTDSKVKGAPPSRELPAPNGDLDRWSGEGGR